MRGETRTGVIVSRMVGQLYLLTYWRGAQHTCSNSAATFLNRLGPDAPINDKPGKGSLEAHIRTYKHRNFDTFALLVAHTLMQLVNSTYTL